MTAHPTLLAVLLEDRGLDRYGSFSAAYQKAAGDLDKQLTHSAPSRAQFHRWLTGDLRGLPYTDHCRVLEHMLHRLLRRPALPALPRPRTCPHPSAPAREPPRPRMPSSPVPGMAGVEAVFASRSEFAAQVKPQSLIRRRPPVRAAGLSLNLICQQLPDQYLTDVIKAGTELTCLFLDPDGEAIRAREREEEYQPGFLSSLDQAQHRPARPALRDRLPTGPGQRLRIAVYDETIRFNILYRRGRACVVQPYLPHARGVDSPTLLIRAANEPGSLYPVFEHVWDALAKRSTPL